MILKIFQVSYKKELWDRLEKKPKNFKEKKKNLPIELNLTMSNCSVYG